MAAFRRAPHPLHALVFQRDWYFRSYGHPPHPYTARMIYHDQGMENTTPNPFLPQTYNLAVLTPPPVGAPP